jgi:hypothetical protein
MQIQFSAGRARHVGPDIAHRRTYRYLSLSLSATAQNGPGATLADCDRRSRRTSDSDAALPARRGAAAMTRNLNSIFDYSIL